jgi:alpha-tubulin suppressor-like RCC1 family protein
MVSCGDAFTIVLSEKNEVFAFGKLSHGRLGIGPQPKALKQASLGDQSMDGPSDSMSEP